MRCVCRTGTRKSLTSPVVSVVAWRCAACCWKNQTCCCSTNRPTTWMPNPWPGWNASCTTSKAPLWRLLTTVTSSITLQAGSSNLTAVKVFRGKATTPPGWSRKISAWRRKLHKKRRVVSRSRKSWSGYVRELKAASRKVKHVWHALKS